MTRALVLIGAGLAALGLSLLTPWGPCGPASIPGLLLILSGFAGVVLGALVLLVIGTTRIVRAARPRS